MHYRVDWKGQFIACLIRSFKTTYRNPVIVKIKTSQLVIIAVLVGLIYLRVPFGRPYLSSEVMSVSGGLFLVITNTSFTIG